MRKILITAIIAMLFVMPAQAYTREDFKTIYQNEPDQNIKEMGIRQLELELGINTGTDKRTVGHFTRSNFDFCTMTSLVNTKKQTVSGRTETDFTMYLRTIIFTTTHIIKNVKRIWIFWLHISEL